MRSLNLFLIFIVVASMIAQASAIEEILDNFNTIYGTHQTRLDSCDLCHIAGKPQKSTCYTCHEPGKPAKDISLNPYGMKILQNRNMEMNQAFRTLDNLDLDNDGFTTIEEIRELKFPGDNKDKPQKKQKKNVGPKLFDFSKILNFFK